jgi:hypothetical protein
MDELTEYEKWVAAQPPHVIYTHGQMPHGIYKAKPSSLAAALIEEFKVRIPTISGKKYI